MRRRRMMLPCTRFCFLPEKWRWNGSQFSVVSSQCMLSLGPENWELRTEPFGPLFLELFRMMVRPGLAQSHVQPCPRNEFSRFRWAHRRPPVSYREEVATREDVATKIVTPLRLGT